MIDPRIPSPKRQAQLIALVSIPHETGEGEQEFEFRHDEATDLLAWALAERESATKTETERNAAAACGLGPNLVSSSALALPEAECHAQVQEDPFPETIVHMHLDGATRKYIPVDGEELKEMLAELQSRLDAAGRTLGAVIMAALPLAPGEERVPGPEDEHAAVQAVLGLVAMRARAQELLAVWAAQMDGAHEHGSDWMRARDVVEALEAVVEGSE